MLKSYICNQPVGVIVDSASTDAGRRTLPSTAANKPIAVSLDSMVRENSMCVVVIYCNTANHVILAILEGLFFCY